jgi:N-acetylglucosaminyldiphosphoundecaprenol N-acetyl-beta-D-mannosaminyltransferase
MDHKVRLLNVEVDNISMEELVNTFRQGVLLTLHVDSIMKLQKDREFYELIPKFDVITCDSQILTIAARLLGTPLKERVSGSDYFPRFYARYRDDLSVTVFICGGAPGVAEIAQRKINATVGRQMVVGTSAPSSGYDQKPEEIDQLIAQINRSGATVLLVGLGGGRQEKFIFRYRDRMPGVKLFLPLGGTIDYEAETLRRPPAWITDAGLEWLYRVLREPRQRWYRYFVHQPPVVYLLARQLLGVYSNPFDDVSSVRSQ